VAHGVLCKIIGLRLKNSGVLLLGWLPIGAFVEPDEQAFKRLRLRDKRRILVAGSTSNALFFVLFFFLTAACALAFPFFVASVSVDSTHYAALLPQGAQLAAVGGAPARTAGAANAALLKASAAGVEVETVDGKRAFVPPTAVVVKEALKGKPAEGILRAGDVVYSFGGARVSSITELKAALASRGAGETVSLETSAGEKKIVLAASASAAGGGEIGALFSQEPGFNAVDVPAPGAELLYSLFSLLLVILAYCFLLNFVLAAVNLLPIFITDGQRIFFEEFSAVPVLGKKKGAVLSFAVGLLTVALLVINALPWKTALGY
jgi:membrane-associated protease RseP (regulator of RpoE activity)